MGLDTTHNAWHGGYGSFNRWREEIAKAAGLPPLELMEGFYDNKGSMCPFNLLDYAYSKGDELEMYRVNKIRDQLPIKWDCLKPNPLYILLYHSDCDGYINWTDCKKIADQLTKLINKLPDTDFAGHIGNIREKTQIFVDGLMLAHSKKEKLIFG